MRYNNVLWVLTWSLGLTTITLPDASSLVILPVLFESADSGLKLSTTDQYHSVTPSETYILVLETPALASSYSSLSWRLIHSLSLFSCLLLSLDIFLVMILLRRVRWRVVWMASICGGWTWWTWVHQEYPTSHLKSMISLSCFAVLFCWLCCCVMEYSDITTPFIWSGMGRRGSLRLAHSLERANRGHSVW